ncbi:DUF2628 domain-containing protein [Prosthecomicrobium pneumaticum]|uniref:DUF2628 domain-containing protein n=1 Tax=Prosthecomicrobium pneumaticum TaxID=81895 RepID=A0A7W9FNT3_9HYPH|nr:DUF2628 domain-containing protein [Prosthecomicrobium pneumaticum]MBB5754093.1 hypothetical protein [Prosthecomicrobium pneumaticum]
MKTYVVMAPRDTDAADRLVFVKDGFCWPAFFLPLVWLLYRRMWIVFLGFVLVTAGLEFAGRQLGEGISGLVAALAVLLFALEANALRRWTLSGRGWRTVGVASGRSIDEAELRFFAGLDDPAPPEVPAAPRSPLAGVPVTAHPPVLGLFPEAAR